LHIVEIVVDESAGLMIRLVDEAVLVNVDREDFVGQILVDALLVFIVKPCVDVVQLVVVEIDVEVLT
jgi:hypothetical protein